MIELFVHEYERLHHCLRTFFALYLDVPGDTQKKFGTKLKPMTNVFQFTDRNHAPESVHTKCRKCLHFVKIPENCWHFVCTTYWFDIEFVTSHVLYIIML